MKKILLVVGALLLFSNIGFAQEDWDLNNEWKVKVIDIDYLTKYDGYRIELDYIEVISVDTELVRVTKKYKTKTLTMAIFKSQVNSDWADIQEEVTKVQKYKDYIGYEYILTD